MRPASLTRSNSHDKDQQGWRSVGVHQASLFNLTGHWVPKNVTKNNMVLGTSGDGSLTFPFEGKSISRPLYCIKADIYQVHKCES